MIDTVNEVVVAVEVAAAKLLPDHHLDLIIEIATNPPLQDIIRQESLG